MSNADTLSTTSDQKTDLKYEDNPDFNAWLNDKHGVLEAVGENYYFSKTTAEIMSELDSDAYGAAFEEYKAESAELAAQELESFKQLIFDEFPGPVAFYFYSTEKSYETNKQRLERLRDTWEALIFLLFALVVGECRHVRLPLKGLKLPNGSDAKLDDFHSDKLAVKLDIVKAIFDQAAAKNIVLLCRDLVSDQVLDDIRDLNRVRNGFSHIAALSEEQSKQFYAENIDKVMQILRGVSGLQNVKLMRYRGNGDTVFQLRCETFSGSRLLRDIQVVPIKQEHLGANAPYLQSHIIIVKHGDLIYSASPFIHFRLDSSGHHTDLCFYKQKAPSAKYDFEIVGRSETIEFDRSVFQNDIDSLRNLLQQI